MCICIIKPTLLIRCQSPSCFSDRCPSSFWFRSHHSICDHSQRAQFDPGIWTFNTALKFGQWIWSQIESRRLKGEGEENCQCSCPYIWGGRGWDLEEDHHPPLHPPNEGKLCPSVWTDTNIPQRFPRVRDWLDMHLFQVYQCDCAISPHSLHWLNHLINVLICAPLFRK